MPALKQFSSGLEIPLCHLGTMLSNYITAGYPASYVGLLQQGDYITIEHEKKVFDLLVDGIAMTKDYNCPHHEGQRHVLLSAHHADNLELLYFFNARNKERKARRKDDKKAS